MCDIVDPYELSPHEITRANWREFLGNKQYCKAYKDFFEQELTANGNNWRKKFLDLLLEDKVKPMINGVVCDLLHPLIHIGYAFELNSPIVAIEALAQTAVCYNPLHEVIDNLKPPKSGSKSALKVFQDIRSDDRLFVADAASIIDNIKLVMENLNDLVLYHYDQWKMDENNFAHGRPEINIKLIDDYHIDDVKNSWDYVIDRTLNSSLAEITHLVKVVHLLRAAEAAYGAKDGLYLKTAVKTVDNVHVDDPWVGA
ncbi:unnamed protein product [Rotaria sp. Silwood2]|nr:unnamed protein product [Rotaria sp. Silwood2]CAF3159932.1 unnamed protein product [Rotaria sp. Silwood2]CAF3908618.1 unnamed protein product [Rotaria sp. Silwood2]CAF3946393.1 unnamed protein product [Rotaria sp. Silwood2]